MENDGVENRGFSHAVDYFLSNPDKWRVYMIYLVLQCVVGIALVITVTVGAVGRLTDNTLSRAAGFPISEPLSNNTTTCDKKETRFFNLGSHVFVLIMLILIRLSAPIYVYLKKKYFLVDDDVK